MKKNVILKFANVKKEFTGVSVLGNLSFQVEKEEIVCILGPSGCGKSTILNIIMDIIQPSFGKVENKSKNTSYVFQEDRLLPWKNVYENIQLVNEMNSHGDCMDLIERLGLKGFEGFLPCELSGGMRQRCAIARAFNYEADLLLMDEPFKSLDYNLRINMISYLLTIWERDKKAILFVTHEIDEALLLGDRILLLTNRPTQVYSEFSLTMPKMKRKLTDSYLVEIRNQIISLLQIGNEKIRGDFIVDS